MFALCLVIFLSLLLLATPSFAATCGNGPADFETKKPQFTTEARAKGVGVNALFALMAANYAQATITP